MSTYVPLLSLSSERVQCTTQSPSRPQTWVLQTGLFNVSSGDSSSSISLRLKLRCIPSRKIFSLHEILSRSVKTLHSYGPGVSKSSCPTYWRTTPMYFLYILVQSILIEISEKGHPKTPRLSLTSYVPDCHIYIFVCLGVVGAGPWYDPNDCRSNESIKTYPKTSVTQT